MPLFPELDMETQATTTKNRQDSIREGSDNSVLPSERNYCGDAGDGQKTFGRIDDAKLKNLRERLRSLRYTEETISKRLRIWHISAITLPQYPVYQERLRQNFDALSILILLFLIQSEVPREAADNALTSDVVDDLLLNGLLIPASAGAVIGTVSIYPCSGFHFITDHHFRPVSHEYYSAPAQPVMHLGPDSYALAYLAPKTPKGGRVLDLCTGSGVQAILAARKAKCVIGIDINPRAVEFARFNAALNGVAQRCDFRCGSLYEPLKQSDSKRDSERFDLILANPPFVPSPYTGPDRLLSRDAGPAGEEILIPVLEGLLTHMTPRGWAAIISFFADQKQSRSKTKIKRWIGSQVPVNLLLLKLYSTEPEELASWFTWHMFGDDFEAYSQRYKEWLEALRSKHITQLTNGVLVVRISRNESSGFRAINVPLPARPQHDTIQSEFDRLIS